MEALLRKYDKECMKMAMLKHEQVFKRQVHELHRLYRIQKLLMRDIQTSEPKGRQRQPRCSQAHLFANLDSSMLAFLPSNSANSERRSRRGPALDLELPADEYIVRAEEQGEVEQEDIDVELTLKLGNNSWRKREDAAFARSYTSSFSSSSTESGGVQSLNGAREWGLHHHADDVHFGHQISGLPNGFELEEGTGDEGGMKQSSSWFMECLSLKMA